MIYAMIPARSGSERLRFKNLALLQGKPLISYAINAAKESGVFDRIFINSDWGQMEELSKKYSVDFYCRPSALGESHVHSDDVVADFICKHGDIKTLAWINPIAPLQTSDEIRRAYEHFMSERLDSMIASRKYFLHAMYNGSPVNYDPAKKFLRTQDLEPIEVFTYSTMIWNADVFMRQYNETGNAMISGRFSTFPSSIESSYIVKTAHDLKTIEAMMSLSKCSDTVDYDPMLEISM